MASIEELLAQQEHVMNTIHRALPNLKKLGKAKWTIPVVRQRLASLKETFTKCQELDIKLNMSAIEAQKANSNYFSSKLFYQCEDYYNEAANFTETLGMIETSQPSVIHKVSQDPLPALATENPVGLRKLRDLTNSAIQALKNLERPVDYWDDMLVLLVSQNLDRSTRKAWELRLGDSVEYPTYNELDKFLKARLRALDSMKPTAHPVTSHTLAQPTASVLLATTHIREHTTGPSDYDRALLDQGSAATLLSNRIAQLLRVNRNSSPLWIAEIDGTRTKTRGTTTIQFSPCGKMEPAYTTTAHILSSLTQYRPDHVPCSTEWRHIRGLQLVDPDPFGSDLIDLIIGADLYGRIFSDGRRIGGGDEPTAQNTVFGWILSGRVSSGKVESVISTYHTTLETIGQRLRQFWEMEEIPITRQFSLDDKKCEDHFKTTYTRTRGGRYIVRLPFKSAEPMELGNSRSMATASLLRLERRLSSDVEKQTAYTAFMKEYEDFGHMTRKDQDDAASIGQRYYIPHHAVFRQSSVTTKLRVVFNASAVITTGHSLNQFLSAGPKLQTDLFAILLAWRQYRVVLTADIEKMYRQIRMDDRGVDFQRILWRPTIAELIAEYQLRTVTYGTTSALFLALRDLQQLTEDEGARYPLAVPVLRHNAYIDDCIFGADTLELAAKIRDQLTALLSCGGFILRKWASNRLQLLDEVDPENHGLAGGKDLLPDDTLYVLGICWHPGRDTLQFRTALPQEPGTTKHQISILFTISRFYDPLGLATPVLLKAKMLMQHLWALRCGWDETIPESVKTEWACIHADLPALEELTVPRWTGFHPGPRSYELHAFADASTRAYAATIYLRLIPQVGSSAVTLLIAKSRVAPLKTISVSRLELCAAVLSARLLRLVTTTLKLEASPIYC
ncbi:uncharacterized protein LOC112589052 [Harpegnathos saltator]|uniref:uncharacterized protein LOC112589052 n=1 Tax=Harpegnathos saltator TaxID=610380 RepID=UPI000DBEDB69|nr:uncharacterized protein LOC112589052 [Harpegnathos saltator]